MIRGGYHILDFKDKNVTAESAVTIPGIYEGIEGSYRKAILASGITLDGVEQRDIFVDLVHTDNSYTFTAYGRTFTVKNDETVSVSAKS